MGRGLRGQEAENAKAEGARQGRGWSLSGFARRKLAAKTIGTYVVEQTFSMFAGAGPTATATRHDPTVSSDASQGHQLDRIRLPGKKSACPASPLSPYTHVPEASSMADARERRLESILRERGSSSRA